MQTPHRRKIALASFAIVLAPVLSSCGFDYATDYENSIVPGSNDRAGSVDVLSAFVVSDKAGRGVLIASLANNDRTETVSLTGVTSEQADVSAFAPVEVGPQAMVNLNDEALDPIQVTDPGTEFEPASKKAAEAEHATYQADAVVQGGQHVRVQLQFSTKETVSVNVPVVRNCGYYSEVAGLEQGAEVCPSGNDLKQEAHH